jgi:acyl-CoA synthetase (AMP-forming)/AMP-acid ligase II
VPGQAQSAPLESPAAQRVALDDGTRQLSFAQLDARADALAHWLLAQGVVRGDVVGLAEPRGIEATVAALAVARAAAILCPLNSRYKPAELAPLLQQARPRLVLAAPGRVETLAQACGLAQVDVRVVPFELETHAGEASVAPHALPDVAEDDAFTLLFTSGTTGQPKGAVATHRARMAWIRSALDVYGVGADDRFLSAMPQAHSAGLTFTLIHLCAGASVRVLDGFDPARALQVLREEGITSLLAVPTMLRRLVDALPAHEPPFASLRRVLSCGSPLPAGTREDVLERLSPLLHDYYGCTESSSIAVLRPHEQRLRPGSVGRPFPGVRVRVVDPQGNACAPGVTGEIQCDNPHTMRGYWNDPAATAQAFDGPWYRTGDLGHLDADGYLHVQGRTGDVIISGGINIHPAEVEQVLQAHPAVAEVAVAGVPDPLWGRAVKAYVVPRAGLSVTLEELQAHCMRHLADFKKPRSLAILDALPRNAAGKVVRGKLEP